MDNKRFDALTRAAATGGSRRGFLKGVFAAAVGLGVQQTAHAAKTTTTTTTSAPIILAPNVSPSVCFDVCKSTNSSQKQRQKCGCGATTTAAPTTSTTAAPTTTTSTTAAPTTTQPPCNNGSQVCSSNTDCTVVPNSACIDVGGIKVCLCPDGTYYDDATRSCQTTTSGSTGTAGCQSAYDTTNPSNCDVQVCKTQCSGGQTVVGTCAYGYDGTTWVCAGENKAGVLSCTTDTDCTNVSAVYTKCIVLSPTSGAKACAVDCNN